MTGGGAATNSGIDFQHRVGALALLTMLTDVADLDVVGLGGVGERPLQIRFESDDEIDDIVIIVNEGRIFVQAKNTISLSPNPDSEFAKVIHQFVNQSRQRTRTERYVLAVSSEASSKIRIDLKKLCESYRLNEFGVQGNPLTQNERQVLDITKEHISREFGEMTGSVCDESFRTDLMRHIYVETFDVTEGGTTERLAITALATIAKTSPILLWRNLIALCLSLARGRLSIDTAALTSRLATLVRPSNDPNADKLDDEFRPRPVITGSLSMGRDVILAQDDVGRMILAELRRFNDDGSRRLHYANGYIKLPNGISWLVIRRTSTFAGIDREIKDGSLIKSDNDVIFFESDLQEADDGPSARAHAEAFERQLEDSDDLLACLVCGRQISENLSYQIEIDEDGHPNEIGMVHRNCLRPTYRVLGVVQNELFANNPQLVDFDFQTWIRSLKSGQGLFNSLGKNPQKGVVPIAWNPDYAWTGIGTYGIAYDLDNGITRYVLARGKVRRMSRQQAEAAAADLGEAVQNASAEGDPYCADERAFGPYSSLVSPDNPAPSKVVKVYAQPLTKSAVLAYSTVENFYAPLFHLVNAETGQPFAISNGVVLLTDPLKLGSLIKNWKMAGITFPPYATVILPADRDFDLFMREAEEESMLVIIDPIFDADANPIGGFLVGNINKITAQTSSENE